MPPERHLDPGIAQWTTQALARLLATFAIAQGANVIVGGKARWSASAFHVALSVPGAPASWGVALCLLGALALAGTFTRRHRATAAALFGISVWCLFFAISFAAAAVQGPRVATTGVFAYGTFAITAATLAAAYWQARHD